MILLEGHPLQEHHWQTIATLSQLRLDLTNLQHSPGVQRWHRLRKKEQQEAFVSQPPFPFGFVKTDDMSIIQPCTCLRHVMENEHME